MNKHESAKLDRLTQWYTNHRLSLLSSLQDLFKKPFANLMTLMVIGIAVALPAGLYILLQNLQSISQHWDNGGSISLYLKKGTPDFKISAMLTDLKKNTAVKKVKYISPEQGLRDFEQATQFGNIFSELKQNPLPGVIVITPTKDKRSPADLNNLINQFQRTHLIDVAQVDFAWIQRLYYIITIGKRITYSLALLFGLGVLLIIGNTIRLTIEHHYEEMAILKLVGATDTFIRRPILYRGLLYGVFGGTLAWLLISISLSWLKPPAQALANSYHQNFFLQGLTFSSGLLILACSATLGVIGAWLAAHRQLRTLS